MRRNKKEVEQARDTTHFPHLVRLDGNQIKPEHLYKLKTKEKGMEH